MKKRFKFLIILFCIALSVFSFTACSDAGAPAHDTKNPEYAVSQDDLKSELEEFLQLCPDRTSYGVGEEFAANYLIERLLNYGYNNAEILDFTTSEGDVSNLTSRNVVAKYISSNSDENTKNVIIGACYDNRYSEAYDGATVYKSESALASGTGVATLLVIAKYLQTEQPELDFNVSLVFFGGSYVSDVGAQAYYKQMEREERANTVLMVELQRLGVDHVYAFSDARETKRESFFDAIAEQNGLDIYKVTQKSPLVTSASAFDGIPYYQWAHNGVFGVFFNAGIPTLNLVGANWETIDMTDAESADHANISYTSNDKLSTLAKLHPYYAERMAEAATLVIRSLESEEFLSTMNYDRTYFPDTEVLTKTWAWYLVVLGFIIIVAVVMMIIVSVLNKKYPIVAPAPKRMKMAVFGMDYEDKDSSDIFIDIKEPVTKPDDDIFPGIPNNDSGTPFDDIFAPLFGMPIETVQPPVSEIKPQETRMVDETPQTETHNITEIQGTKESAKNGDNIVTEIPATEEQAKKDSAVEKPPVQKRKTTSAGKSTSAKKTTGAKKSVTTAKKPEDKNGSDETPENKE